MKAIERAALRSGAGGVELELLLHIAHLADDDGTYWGEDRRLEILARFRSRGAFLKVVQNLVQTGLLEPVNGGYRLLLPHPEEGK